MDKNGRIDTSIYEKDIRYIREKYKSLQRKQKSALLKKLIVSLDISQSTLCYKFSGNRLEFKPAEVRVIKEEIDNFEYS